jgi:NAD(P)-dependent dehydrogenase (short-subunit alcohol dehydrogenase family)
MGRETFAARAERMATPDLEAARSQAIAWHPIGRLGTASDIARAILFLASDEAGFITGTGLAADGGWTAQ